MNFFESRNTVVITTLLDVDDHLDDLSYSDYRWVDGRSMRAYGGFVKRISGTKNDDDFKAYILPSVSQINFVRKDVVNTPPNDEVVVTGSKDRLVFKLENKVVEYELCKSSIVDVENEMPDNDGVLKTEMNNENDIEEEVVENEEAEVEPSVETEEEASTPSVETEEEVEEVEPSTTSVETEEEEEASTTSIENEEVEPSIPSVETEEEAEEVEPSTPSVETEAEVEPSTPSVETKAEVEPSTPSVEEEPEPEKPKSIIESVINGINNQITNLKLSSLMKASPDTEENTSKPKLIKIDEKENVLPNLSPAAEATAPAEEETEVAPAEEETEEETEVAPAEEETEVAPASEEQEVETQVAETPAAEEQEVETPVEEPAAPAAEEQEVETPVEEPAAPATVAPATVATAPVAPATVATAPVETAPVETPVAVEKRNLITGGNKSRKRRYFRGTPTRKVKII
jgi:hypothetical protein